MIKLSFYKDAIYRFYYVFLLTNKYITMKKRHLFLPIFKKNLRELKTLRHSFLLFVEEILMATSH